MNTCNKNIWIKYDNIESRGYMLAKCHHQEVGTPWDSFRRLKITEEHNLKHIDIEL